jgi:hypothetical protein
MKFPDLHQAKEKLVHNLADKEGIFSETIRVVASPYRICPQSAHIDH